MQGVGTKGHFWRVQQDLENFRILGPSHKGLKDCRVADTCLFSKNLTALSELVDGAVV